MQLNVAAASLVIGFASKTLIYFCACKYSLKTWTKIYSILARPYWSNMSSTEEIIDFGEGLRRNLVIYKYWLEQFIILSIMFATFAGGVGALSVLKTHSWHHGCWSAVTGHQGIIMLYPGPMILTATSGASINWAGPVRWSSSRSPWKSVRESYVIESQQITFFACMKRISIQYDHVTDNSETFSMVPLYRGDWADSKTFQAKQKFLWELERAFRFTLWKVGEHASAYCWYHGHIEFAKVSQRDRHSVLGITCWQKEMYLKEYRQKNQHDVSNK